ncbi:YrhK family protein [Allorhizobium pseudoryzae]|uniref:YrhK family protein n=1 Tax=Allorhizobium pseudoryzae TaxID=379684 RepID=UPI003D05D70B
MPFFSPGTALESERSRRIYAVYELIYTAIDVAAALLFITGSLLFFQDETQTAGTWCFLVGSFCFAAKPFLRIAREVSYWRTGDYEDLARRADG